MNRLHLETLDLTLMPVSPADGQKDGECDMMQCFALFEQSLQMGTISANAQVGKDANLTSCATELVHAASTAGSGGAHQKSIKSFPVSTMRHQSGLTNYSLVL